MQILAGFVVIALALGLVAVFLKSVQDGYTAAPPRPTHLCLNCRNTITPLKVEPGNNLTAFVLYLFAIVPGVFYSLWRATHKRVECPACQAPNPIPLNSPAAKALAER